MSGFKGTKEKWIVQSGVNNGLITISSKTAYICDVDAHEEGEYNAILISKAPEMLEMLEKISQFIDENENINYKVRMLAREVPNIKQLIQEATTI